ncbi:hypothetical protein N336_11611, partial [Phalacrocorax carbo]
WPLTAEKTEAVRAIVKREHEAGHLEPSMSPWNTPIFAIKKKDKNQWRMLHDLRAVNQQMEDMGPLQPGLPDLSAVPRGWQVIVLDIKDCFFSIPLHPDDRKRFAFTLPAVNRTEPGSRWQWTVLPQGMKNSPAICQRYVASALQQVRQQYQEQIYMIHYMDDVLIAAPTEVLCEQVFADAQRGLAEQSLKVAKAKVQRGPVCRFLGARIEGDSIQAQPIKLTPKVKNLHDVQKLVGALQWLRTFVRVTGEEMQPFYALL